jgi:hypothetical protein
MKSKFCISCILYFTIVAQSFGQQKTENVIVVTLDGMRWQEVFSGADSSLLNNKIYTRDSADTWSKFWNNDVLIRRKNLFPFLWTDVAEKGQLYGNRQYDNKVNNANKYKFSYPGYNEIFTGYPDTAVNSNDKIPNKNINVLEFINQQASYKNKVAAFATWDVFPYILNKWRSGIYVNADTDMLPPASEKFKLINDIETLTARPIGVRPDVLTYIAAREYLKHYMPKLLYIAFDETDDYAHRGMYDQYLGSAHAQDKMIEDLWNYVQSTPGYKDKTTLLILCDHGRGDKIKDNWQHHGEQIEEAGEIWIAAIGPDTKPLGEVKIPMQLYQMQVAATISKLLGVSFTSNHPVAVEIKDIYTK